MIFKIDKSLFAHYNPSDVSELFGMMIRHNHYIDCADASVYNKICHCINTHGSTRDKELLLQYRRFSVDTFRRLHLTTIDVNEFRLEQLIILSDTPARLVPENSREWDVYVHMIKTYKRNVKVREIASVLDEAVEHKNLRVAQIGGVGEFVSQINSLARQDYDGETIPYKCCVIIDRDVNSDISSHGTWNLPDSREALFMFLSGKDTDHLTPSDVYSVDQPIFHWHMWYKRTIENYFPDRAFINMGCDLTIFNAQPEVRDFRHSKHISGYKKDNIANLVRTMGLADYNSNLKQFPHNGIMYTELELLLFKLCKII